jgi:hypothetical protein
MSYLVGLFLYSLIGYFSSTFIWRITVDILSIPFTYLIRKSKYKKNLFYFIDITFTFLWSFICIWIMGIFIDYSLVIAKQFHLIDRNIILNLISYLTILVVSILPLQKIQLVLRKQADDELREQKYVSYETSSAVIFHGFGLAIALLSALPLIIIFSFFPNVIKWAFGWLPYAKM